MALTSNQYANIAKLSTDDQFEIVLSCVENLGLMPVSEYAKLMGINRREVYRQVLANKVKHMKISDVIFIAVNDRKKA